MRGVGFDLAARMRSCIETSCGRCGGPISVGELIVSDPFGRGPCDMWHRGCFFATPEACERARRARRASRPSARPEPVPGQAELFAGDR